MPVPDEVLRAALEEYIAFGPQRVQPVEERLARRLPLTAPEERSAAIAVAREAVGVAEALAREYVSGSRTQDAVVAELARRYPWLHVASASTPRSWWCRLAFWTRAPEADLAAQLGHFGYYLVIM